MSAIRIRYQDASSEVTERTISDPHMEDRHCIDAFCHLRNGRRSFKLDRIILAINPESGVLMNPYQIVNSMCDPNSLDSLTWKIRQAVKAVKFFSLSTRGFAMRERGHVIDFIKEAAEVSAYSDEEVGEWAHNLWCADVYKYRDGEVGEYEELLKSISFSLLEQCRNCAFQIVTGSGRKPPNPNWIERIEAEFNPHPVVKQPENQSARDDY